MNKILVSFAVMFFSAALIFAQNIPAADSAGNTYSCASESKKYSVLKTASDGSSSTIWTGKEKASSVVVGKDGRIYVLCSSGEVVSFNSDGSDVHSVKVLFADLDSTPDLDLSTISADQAPISMKSGKLDDNGDIIVIASDGVYKLLRSQNYRIAVISK